MDIKLKFNPNFQTDDESVSNFVVRRYEFETIIDALSLAANSHADPPHFLVTAPRGAGKTTLCRRVAAEIHLSPRLQKAWQVVFLGEETYAVTTPGEFLLECLLQLKNQVPSRQLDEGYIQTVRAQSEAELHTLALMNLQDFVRATGKRLLVIVENFYTMLNEQIQESKGVGTKGLINTLDNPALFAVLATSVAQASDGQTGFLPQHYHWINIPPITRVECHELWESLTGTEVNEEKLRPLEILTGGNPRLLHILAEFTRTPSLHELMANLNFLIDQNTEYFKSQLDALPTLERKVFVTLLDIWDPSTAKQVAEAARVNTNTASAMLARLTGRGVVTKTMGQDRTAIYVVAERLFNIYYLMRRHNHPSSRIRALVTFMMAYYDSEELVEATARLMYEACGIEPSQRSDYHSTFEAIMSCSPEAVREQIQERIPSDFIRSFRDDFQISYRGDDCLPHVSPPTKRDAETYTLDKSSELTGDKDSADAVYDSLDPKFIEAHLFLASLEADRANLRDAIRHLEVALTDLPSRQELIPVFVNAAMTVADLDSGDCLANLLDQHKNAEIVEPLVAAVRLARGEEPMVAKEIMDVAWDILTQSSTQKLVLPSRDKQ